MPDAQKCGEGAGTANLRLNVRVAGHQAGRQKPRRPNEWTVVIAMRRSRAPVADDAGLAVLAVRPEVQQVFAEFDQRLLPREAQPVILIAQQMLLVCPCDVALCSRGAAASAPDRTKHASKCVHVSACAVTAGQDAPLHARDYVHHRSPSRPDGPPCGGCAAFSLLVFKPPGSSVANRGVTAVRATIRDCSKILKATLTLDQCRTDQYGCMFQRLGTRFENEGRYACARGIHQLIVRDRRRYA